MRTYRRWAVCLFAAVLPAQSRVCCAATFLDQAGAEKADAKTATAVHVSGKVMDRDGKGIGNAEVTFAGARTVKTTTDADGSFGRELTPGKYKVTAKSGSKSKTIDAEIKSENSDLSLVVE